MIFKYLSRNFNKNICLPISLAVNNDKKYSCKSARGPPWNVLFFGTDSFALYSLKALWAKLNTATLLTDLAVVSKQGCLVRKFAETEGLTVYDWPLKSKDIESKYHIGMVVSFGNLIPENIIKSFPLGCINVHASLLPRWRGAAPIIHAISNGDMETGITIMRIHPHKFDTGEIVRQYRLPIDPYETSKDLENKLGLCGANLLMECLRDLPRCLDMAIPQPKEGVTYAPKVNSSMSSINWDSMTAVNVFNLHRALKHVYPLTTRWQKQIIKLHQISLDKLHLDETLTNNSPEISKKSALDFLLSDNKSTDKIKSTLHINPGQLVYDKRAKQLKVICSDGQYVIINKLSLAGKTMTGGDFYNGFMSKTRKDLWSFTN